MTSSRSKPSRVAQRALPCAVLAAFAVACGGSSSSSSGSTNPPPPANNATPNLTTTYFGSAGSERVQGVSVLHNGDVLVCGDTTSDFASDPHFPHPTTPFYDEQHSNPGNELDGYVAILTPDLSAVKAWTYLGGTREDRAYFAMEGPAPAYDIWVTGFTASGCACSGSCEPFPVTPGSCFTTPSAFCNAAGLGSDVFVSRLSSDLRQLESSLLIGGRFDDTPRGSLWVDATDGSAYVSGSTSSDDFYTDVAGGAPNASTGCTSGVGVHDAFVLKLDASGGLVWSRCFGGANDDQAWGGVRTTASGGELFVAGATNSHDCAPAGLPGFDWLLNADGSPSAHWDGFVVKLATADGSLVAFTYCGGTQSDWVTFNDCLELDPSGRPVVCGMTRSGDLPLAGRPLDDRHSNGDAPLDQMESNDVFVAIFDPSLTALTYGSYVNRNGNVFSASEREEPAGLAVDAAGNVFISGETVSPGFPTTVDAFDRRIMTSGQDDAFVFELQPSFVPQEPSVLRYSSFFGGDDDVGSAAEEGNRARCLTLVPDSGVFPGQVLFSGQTTTDDFPTVAPENGSVLELKWLPGDTRQGFIAYHAVP